MSPNPFSQMFPLFLYRDSGVNISLTVEAECDNETSCQSVQTLNSASDLPDRGTLGFSRYVRMWLNLGSICL